MSHELPPPPPPWVAVAGEEEVQIPLSLSKWYGARSVYSDHQRGHIVHLRAEALELVEANKALRLQALSDQATIDSWEAVARQEHRRPSWSAVVGVGLAGALVGGAGVLYLNR